ncbi:MAG: ComEA family DNA-binding protein [Luteitalea sp.]
MTSLVLAAFLVSTVPLLSASAPATGAALTDGQAAKVAAPSHTVNVNTATQQQFDALPGIGPTTAQRIVAYREKNGPFKKLEDLMNIQGIGEKSFLKLRPHLTLGGSGDGKPAQQ